MASLSGSNSTEPLPITPWQEEIDLMTISLTGLGDEAV